MAQTYTASVIALSQTVGVAMGFPMNCSGSDSSTCFPITMILGNASAGAGILYGHGNLSYTTSSTVYSGFLGTSKTVMIDKYEPNTFPGNTALYLYIKSSDTGSATWSMDLFSERK